MAEKFSDFIRSPGTAGPPTREGIHALGFALETDIDPILEKTVRVDEAQSFSSGEQLQGRQNIGLGNVDNTSDANKPVSTAQQTALNLKANLNSPALTGTPTAPTAPPGTNTTQLATTAFVMANPVVDGSITNAKLANMAAATIKGRASGDGTGAPTDLVAADVFTILGALVPARPVVASGPGEFAFVNTATGAGYTLPAGGTWAYSIIAVTVSTGAVVTVRCVGGIAAGGTVVAAAQAGESKVGFAWRVA